MTELASTRKLFALLACCAVDTLPLGKCLRESIKTIFSYRQLAQIDDYVFITEEAKKLETRARSVLDFADRGGAVAELLSLSDRIKAVQEELQALAAESEGRLSNPEAVIDIVSKNKYAPLLQIKISHTKKLMLKAIKEAGLSDLLRIVKPDFSDLNSIDTSAKSIRDLLPSITYQLQHTLKGHTSAVNTIAVSEGKIISGSSDKTIKIWDIITGKCLNTLKGHTSAVDSIAVSGGKIISGSSDKTIKIWDIATGRGLKTLYAHIDTVHAIAVSDGKIISGSWDEAIKIWDITTGRCINTLEGHTAVVRTIAISDGKIISGSWDETIKIWDIATGRCLNTLASHAKYGAIAISDGKIVSESDDKKIKIWDIATGRCLNTLEGHTSTVDTIAVSEGKIISGSSDKTIKIWDIATGKCLYALEGRTSTAHAIAISDGKIVSGLVNNSIKIWDIATGNYLNTLVGHRAAVRTIAISDGKIISGSDDKMIKIWDMQQNYVNMNTENCFDVLKQSPITTLVDYEPQPCDDWSTNVDQNIRTIIKKSGFLYCISVNEYRSYIEKCCGLKWRQEHRCIVCGEKLGMIERINNDKCTQHRT